MLDTVIGLDSSFSNFADSAKQLFLKRSRLLRQDSKICSWTLESELNRHLKVLQQKMSEHENEVEQVEEDEEIEVERSSDELLTPRALTESIQSFRDWYLSNTNISEQNSSTESAPSMEKILGRSCAVNLREEPYFENASNFSRSTGRESALSGLLQNLPECTRPDFIPLHSQKWSPPEKIPSIPELKLSGHSKEVLFWELDYRKMTHRRRGNANKKRKRKWEEVDVDRIKKKMDFVVKVNATRSYYSIFRHNKGHTFPWKELIFSLIWTTVLLGLHQKYYDLGDKWFGQPLNPTFSYSFFNYFCLALGFLLYIQAEASSLRWWEGRVHWQRMMEDSKRLTALVNTHLSCLRMSMLATQMMIAHTICVRNILQDKLDAVWWGEMLEVLDPNIVDMIMRHPRRLRYLAVLYAFQRIITVAIENGMMPKEVIRDINPTIISMGQSFGACNCIRITKLPWIVMVHLNFMLFCFSLILPLSLIELQHVSQLNFIDDMPVDDLPVVQVYLYVFFVSYAFFGLCRMAIDIEDPFSFTREHHSFGYWGFYVYWSEIEIESIKSVLDLRLGKHGEKGIAATGNYGDNWAADKLEDDIRKIVEDELPTSHNLWNRRSLVLECLQRQRRRNTLFWEDFNKRLLENESPFCPFVSESSCDHVAIDNDTIKPPDMSIYELMLTDSNLQQTTDQ